MKNLKRFFSILLTMVIMVSIAAIPVSSNVVNPEILANDFTLYAHANKAAYCSTWLSRTINGYNGVNNNVEVGGDILATAVLFPTNLRDGQMSDENIYAFNTTLFTTEESGIRKMKIATQTVDEKTWRYADGGGVTFDMDMTKDGYYHSITSIMIPEVSGNANFACYYFADAEYVGKEYIKIAYDESTVNRYINLIRLSDFKQEGNKAAGYKFAEGEDLHFIKKYPAGTTTEEVLDELCIDKKNSTESEVTVPTISIRDTISGTFENNVLSINNVNQWDNYALTIALNPALSLGDGVITTQRYSVVEFDLEALHQNFYGYQIRTEDQGSVFNIPGPGTYHITMVFDAATKTIYTNVDDKAINTRNWTAGALSSVGLYLHASEGASGDEVAKITNLTQTNYTTAVELEDILPYVNQ